MQFSQVVQAGVLDYKYKASFSLFFYSERIIGHISISAQEGLLIIVYMMLFSLADRFFIEAQLHYVSWVKCVLLWFSWKK